MNILLRNNSHRGASAPKHIVALLFVALLLLLHLGAAVPLLSPSPFDAYTRQALAWWQGLAHLPDNVPHLELAIYKGKYYVSFPPVPSLVILPFTWLMGDQVPDALLMIAYALIAFFAICRALERHGWSPWTAALASLILCAGSSLLPLLLTGAVWYHAQVLAFTLTVLAMERLDAQKPFSGLLCYALAVGCQPFNALYGPLLMALFVFPDGLSKNNRWLHKAKQLLPGIVAGLAMALLYGWYNWLRFDHPLEFGHNHLPEFSFQGGRQFSWEHIPINAQTFLLGLPWINENGHWYLSSFGFSLFLANPLFLCMLGWAAADMLRRRFSWQQAATLALCALHLLLLLSHRTFGGFQYGARYAVDCIPYALLYLLHRKHQKSLSPAAVALLGLGLALAIWGSLTITLPS